MKHSRLVTLAIFLVATVMLSGCVVAGYGDRGDGRYDHDHGEQHDHDHHDGDR